VVCSLAWERDPRVFARSQSSISVTADGESWVLLNASPDLGEQIRAAPGLWPKQALRHSPIEAVVLTNADVDHVAGLLSLRERQPFRLIAREPVHAALRASEIFAVLAVDVVERSAIGPGQRIDAAGLEIELFSVPGKAPLYQEGPDPAVGGETGETSGVLVAKDGRTLAYVPGCASLTPSVLGRIADADVLLFDGTLFTDDEMIAAGVGSKTGRRMGHVPISGPDGSLATLQQLKAARKIYIHINNTNPILIEGSPERRFVEAAGCEIAYDGMEIAF
jgi:pyrroloquinoline quinone biosynthesis protein B